METILQRYFTALLATTALLLTASRPTGCMELFQAKLIEQNNNSRLIATSNYNYAIVNPKLASRNWRTVSVNGDKVLVTTTGGQVQRTTRAALGSTEMSFIEALRDEVAEGGGGAYSHVSTASGGTGGGGSFMMSSNTAGGLGMGTSMSSASSAYSHSGHQASSMFGGGEMSYNMKDQDNFSVSRSDFPYNWSRVFVNGDLATMIFRNGDVEMQPIVSLAPAQLEAVKQIRSELASMQQTQQTAISNTMKQSMDMVSNVFNSIMASFPKPPSFRNAVGDMFGDNFPFGPKNSPFSAASGWPFASGNGAAAVAMAGVR